MSQCLDCALTSVFVSWFDLSADDDGWKRHRTGGSGAKVTWPQFSIRGQKQTHLPRDWCSSLVPLYFFGHSGRCWAACTIFIKTVMWYCVTTLGHSYLSSTPVPFLDVAFPHSYFIHRAASSDSIWGNGLNPSHSFWGAVPSVWQPDPESPH